MKTSRRGFLGLLGIGAGALGAAGILKKPAEAAPVEPESLFIPDETLTLPYGEPGQLLNISDGGPTWVNPKEAPQSYWEVPDHPDMVIVWRGFHRPPSTLYPTMAWHTKENRLYTRGLDEPWRPYSGYDYGPILSGWIPPGYGYQKAS